MHFYAFYATDLKKRLDRASIDRKMKPAELRGGHIGRSHFAARRCKAVYTTEETSHILGDMEGFLRFVYFILHALVYFFIILYSLSHFKVEI